MINDPNKARSLTEEEEEVLWEAEKFGSKTPEALISFMWWLLEFVQFTEGPTKTRQGELQSKNRNFQPQMFFCWKRKVSDCSFQAVCRAKTSKHGCPQYQKKPKTE